jgi:hypothetical protein
MNKLSLLRFPLSLSFTVALLLPGLSSIAGAQQRDWIRLGGPTDVLPVYGKLGVPSPSNTPGAREGAATWIDADGNLWLFSGVAEAFQVDAPFPNDLWEFDVSTLEWTWISGSDKTNQLGVYGTLRVPAKDNVPGSRVGALTWVDADGDLWLFGGDGQNISPDARNFNDLWVFRPSIGEWTWMGGSDHLSCTGNDCFGNPGVYGKKGAPSISNLPGGRGDGKTWVDASGDFWLFGGGGVDSAGKIGPLNDLWKYTASTGAWTWVSGSDLVNGAGNYGELRTPSTSNVPGARSGASNWIDAKGNLWLFGGVYSTTSKVTLLNDLWKFSPSTDEWTWMGGSKKPNQTGKFDTLGATSTAYIPTARASASSWVDRNGKFWLFGGYFFPEVVGESGGADATFNDLWEFNPSTLEWTWVSGRASPSCVQDGGDTECYQPSIDDALDIPSAENAPGSRDYSTGWADKQGNFWLLGGSGYAGNTYDNDLTDVWVYSAPLPAPALSPPKSGTTSKPQIVTIHDATPGAAIYYTTNGREPSLKSSRYTGPITITKTSTVKAFAAVPGYFASAVSAKTYKVELPAQSIP